MISLPSNPADRVLLSTSLLLVENFNEHTATMVPRDFLATVAMDYAISDLEMDVLVHALEGKSMTAIAQQLNLKPEAARKRLGEVYKKFHISGAGPGKLAKLQHLLVAKYQDSQQVNDCELTITEGETNRQPRSDTGDEPSWDWLSPATQVYGRDQELTQLKDWVIHDGCRVIGVWGAKGIGKTCLTLKLGQEMQNCGGEREPLSRFARAVWLSLAYIDSLDEVLDDLIHRLGTVDYPLVGQTSKINHLLAQLNHDRCLIVLDAADNFLLPNTQQHGGSRPDDRATLRNLLSRLATEPSKSCIVLTSLVRSKLMLSLEIHDTVHTLHLTGLAPEAVKLMLQDYALEGSAKDWSELVTMYQGNPLALKKQAIRIRDLFGGSISNFLRFQSTYVNATEIIDTLEQQFRQLDADDKALEKAILVCLQQQPNGLSPLQLKTNLRRMWPGDMSSLKLQAAIDFLWERSLIEFTNIDLKKAKENHIMLPHPVATYLRHHSDLLAPEYP